jgi:hypothetical protein
MLVELGFGVVDELLQAATASPMHAAIATNAVIPRRDVIGTICQTIANVGCTPQESWT